MIITFNVYRILQKPFLNITEILHRQLLRGKNQFSSQSSYNDF